MSQPACAQLPRRAWLGLRAVPAEDGTAKVAAVAPDSTAAAIGILAGDVLRDDRTRQRWSNSRTMPKAGEHVEIEVTRGGLSLRLSGRALARPYEAYAGADVRYGEVKFNGGKLRDILVTPHGAESPPVVFLIQGYNCASMESADPDSAYHRIGAALIEAGIAYYRVEKAAVGDSDGGEPCQSSNFATELDGFRTAYRHLRADLGFSPDRIFLFGHSMGGIQAPMLAAETPPRGVAVYGTIIRNWCDYWQDIDSFQDFIKAGADPVAGYRKGAADREIFRRFCFGGESPAQIAVASPALREPMRRALEWDGADQLAGRHYSYFRQVAAVNLVEAWARTASSVLSIYGESDAEVMSGEDQRLLVEIANHYRPGTARFVSLPETGHAMDVIGNRDTAPAVRRSGGFAGGPFNAKLSETLVSWIRDVSGTARQ